MSNRKSWKDVLKLYRKGKKPDNKTIKSYYDDYRSEQHGIDERLCETQGCPLSVSGSRWNNKPIKMIIDHINGQNLDNTPGNLQYLCPNCNSQQSHTHGGANKYRVDNLGDYAYSFVERETGKKNFVYNPDPLYRQPDIKLRGKSESEFNPND